MNAAHQLGFALVLAGAAAACSAEDSNKLPGESMDPNTNMGSAGTATGPMNQVPVTPAFKPSAEQALNYMRYIGPSLLGRVLTDEEEARINQDAGDAVKPLIEAWVTEPNFAEAIRSMLEIRLGTSGTRGTTDYNLAGNIVRHVVMNKLPWSQVVTSSSCYDANDAPIACDTGAPYTAGVLTTRGFLAGNEGRFNLGRARAMLTTFMCRDYPQEETLQPYIDKPRLKLMFRASNAEEQQVAEVAGGFGNGLACFSCHGQFSNHAQPFVKFDKGGAWLSDATGLQSMTGQLGESDNGTMASHFENATEAASEKAQWFGVEIANLAEGAAAMAKNPKFRECAVQQLLELGVGLDTAFETGIKALLVKPEFLETVAKSVSDKSPDPTIQELAAVTYSDPQVIAATINGLKR
jgi:hypothetical protein